MIKKVTRGVKSEINRRAYILSKEWYEECVQQMVDLYERDQLNAVEIEEWRPEAMTTTKNR